MVDIGNYEGREQAFIKHFFLKNYIETLFFRLAERGYNNITYVDGFSGPWQSNDDKFQDTSFGITLNAMQKVNAHAKSNGKTVKFTAHLVEEDAKAYQELAKIPEKYPELSITTYNDDFLQVIEPISRALKKSNYRFIFIDPKGWKIDLRKLEPLLSLKNSEVIFNFMFDFINRFTSHPGSSVLESLDLLFPYTENWRHQVSECNNAIERKSLIFELFAQNLGRVGEYEFVSQTEILKPTKDRALYALFFATRHQKGIKEFRQQQVKALRQQSETRGETKIKAKESRTGQTEMFKSANEITSNPTEEILQSQRDEARQFILEIVPKKPDNVLYVNLRLETAKRYIVKFADINQICNQLKNEKLIEFPNWEEGRKVPHPHYLVQKP